MSEQRRRGRPALPPEARRVKRGVSLTPTTWAQLNDLRGWWGVSVDQILERLVAEAVGDRHADELHFQENPEIDPHEKAPPGRVPET